MYLHALWLLVLLTALATAWFDAAAAGVVAASKHAALRTAALAVERAQDALVESIAAQAATGATSFTAPTAAPAIPVCPSPNPRGDACLLEVSTTTALEGQTVASHRKANQIAGNLQANAGVDEERLAAAVTAVIATASGTELGRVTRHLTLRTLGAWPYAALSGADEPTLDGYAVGDFAGACKGGGCGDDSRIHAVLECSDPADPHACRGQRYVPVDQFTSPPWRNENDEQGGWSR